MLFTYATCGSRDLDQQFVADFDMASQSLERMMKWLGCFLLSFTLF